MLETEEDTTRQAIVS